MPRIKVKVGDLVSIKKQTTFYYPGECGLVISPVKIWDMGDELGQAPASPGWWNVLVNEQMVFIHENLMNVIK